MNSFGNGMLPQQQQQQASPNGPQATPPNAAGPGMFNKERMNGLVQRLTFLQRQGANEENSQEFAHIMQILRNYQAQQKLQQHRLQQQQQQQQQQAMSPFQQSPMSPVQVPSQQQQQPQQRPPPAVPQPMMPPQHLAQQQQAPHPQGAMDPNVAAAGAVPPVPPQHSVFTQSQLGALKYQILAYKLISKNMPLPDHIQQAVLSPLTIASSSSLSSPHAAAGVAVDEQHQLVVPNGATNMASAPPGVVPSRSSATPGISPSASATHAAVTAAAATRSASPQRPPLPPSSHPQHPQQQQPSFPPAAAIPPPPLPTTTITTKAEYNAYASPYSMMKKPISSYAHASRQHRQLIPSITPCGMDSYEFAEGRERLIDTRIKARMNQLGKLSGSMMDKLSGSYSPSTTTTTTTDATRRRTSLQTLIELKSLRLLSKQKQMRQELVQGISKSSTLAAMMDRSTYRRLKRQSLREARMVEKLERQQRIDLENKKKQRHLDQLQLICDHGRNLISTQRTWQSKQSKLGRAVIQYHQHVEREEQKRIERISKERMRALRNDDEEAYMKLIDTAKDTRLTQLLKQTDNFLGSLTQAVVDQQNDASQRENEYLVQDDTEDKDSKVDYFKVTHRVKEEVSQPNLLVGGTLKDYQIKGLQWMVSLFNNHLNGILADEMGLGKTIQTISLITYLIERKRQNGPFLIIVPLSTLTNWSLEFDKWAPSVKTIVYKGTPPVRRELQMDIRRGDFQVLLTTFDYIIKDRPLLSKTKWLHMIIDEGHRMKNVNSKLTVVLRQYYNTRYRIILTGTPLQNNLPELWALLNFILPKIFKSVKTFEEWFNTPFSYQGVSDKIDLNEEEQLLIIKRLHKVLRPFLLRRLKKDVESELPDKVERVIKCKLSALQAKLYHQMKKNGRMYTSINEKGKMGVKGLNNTIMQLRKICNHPFVYEEVENTINPSGLSNEFLYRVSGKFELLDRTLPKLRETGHRVLIFFQMTQVMSIMEDFMNYRGYRYLRLDGSTKADDRSQLLQVFNSPDSPYFVFLLSTRAGGLGLNLQTADTVIIFDSDWNPHQDLQAQDRAHRIGQTKEVRIFRLISANSIEENILARANYKLDIDGKVIQAGKFDNRSTDEDREAFLRTLLEDKSDEHDDEDDVQEEIDDEELNEMLKRSDQELVIFNRIDAERERAEADYYRQKGRRGRKHDRLIQEDELPEVYRYEDAFAEDVSPLLEYGRGQRVRDTVRYDDGLTEEQWVNALEDENIDLDDLIARKEARRRKAAGLPPLEDSASLNKKRGRPKKGEPDYSSSSSSKKKSRQKKDDKSASDPLSPPLRQQLTRIFDACYKAVEESTEEDEETYRKRCTLFMDLVSKRDYPIYYTMIKSPIAMKMIKKRIHSPYYRNVAQFRNDFHLMFDNARTFNEEGSIVYEDADEIKYSMPNLPNSVLTVNYLHYRRLKVSSSSNFSKVLPSPHRCPECIKRTTVIIPTYLFMLQLILL
ncbi:SNF2 family N-terminal domain-containing protein [Zychaea mexicana]|uniref:SNF2 family N-terminal domain-containing protein n=1 Tax=Zychaea mexicana TaxID=64656 RepID=UPI0022FF183E|nr:SNF2 family N-terminal domain-containing protein [Zychaea mexicana]KAI9497938.1 SNF2 family N-terminal domain-containing protein [Zychaea mexicana]